MPRYSGRSMRQGIGRALVVDAEALARTAHVYTMEVIANASAVPFYERVGFESIATVGTPLGLPARRMRRRVSRRGRAAAGEV